MLNLAIVFLFHSFFVSLFLCFFVSLFLCFFVSLFLCFFVSLFLSSFCWLGCRISFLNKKDTVELVTAHSQGCYGPLAGHLPLRPPLPQFYSNLMIPLYLLNGSKEEEERKEKEKILKKKKE